MPTYHSDNLVRSIAAALLRDDELKNTPLRFADLYVEQDLRYRMLMVAVACKFCDFPFQSVEIPAEDFDRSSAQDMVVDVMRHTIMRALDLSYRHFFDRPTCYARAFGNVMHVREIGSDQARLPHLMVPSERTGRYAMGQGEPELTPISRKSKVDIEAVLRQERTQFVRKLVFDGNK